MSMIGSSFFDPLLDHHIFLIITFDNLLGYWYLLYRYTLVGSSLSKSFPLGLGLALSIAFPEACALLAGVSICAENPNYS